MAEAIREGMQGNCGRDVLLLALLPRRPSHPLATLAPHHLDPVRVPDPPDAQTRRADRVLKVLDQLGGIESVGRSLGTVHTPARSVGPLGSRNESGRR